MADNITDRTRLIARAYEVKRPGESIWAALARLDPNSIQNRTRLNAPAAHFQATSTPRVIGHRTVTPRKLRVRDEEHAARLVRERAQREEAAANQLEYVKKRQKPKKARRTLAEYNAERAARRKARLEVKHVARVLKASQRSEVKRARELRKAQERAERHAARVAARDERREAKREAKRVARELKLTRRREVNLAARIARELEAERRHDQRAQAYLVRAAERAAQRKAREGLPKTTWASWRGDDPERVAAYERRKAKRTAKAAGTYVDGRFGPISAERRANIGAAKLHANPSPGALKQRRHRERRRALLAASV